DAFGPLGDLGFEGVQLGLIDNMNIQGTFDLAYDTYGLREFLNGLIYHQTADVSQLLNGFYINDSTTSLSFDGEIGPQVSASPFPGVSIDCTGGLQAYGPGGPNDSSGFQITFEDEHQQTDDGKDRLSQLFQQSALFDAAGQLHANLSVGFKLGFDTPLGFV